MAVPGTRLQPHQLPQMRAALDRAIATLEPALDRLGREGYIHDPWMGDVVSEEMRVLFNHRLMDAPDSPYRAFVTYLAELQRVRDALSAAEDRYRRTEGDNAELWGRL